MTLVYTYILISIMAGGRPRKRKSINAGRKRLPVPVTVQTIDTDSTPDPILFCSPIGETTKEPITEPDNNKKQKPNTEPDIDVPINEDIFLYVTTFY